jgi:pimeloyl-ACP methyl ester carboxylesterase
MSVEENMLFATIRLTTGPRLHYAEQGDPTGEAIVFLHGYSDSWFSFSRVLPLLSPSYRAFALTERGPRDSEKPQCSGGTLIAARVALSYPHRISRLALIGSAIMGANNEVMSELEEFMRTLEDPVAPEFVRDFQESTIYSPLPEEFLETVVSESLKPRLGYGAIIWRK